MYIRSVCIFVAVWTIIQTIAHSLWAIGFTFTHLCMLETTNESVFYYIYITYMYNRQCGNLSIIVNEHDLLVYLPEKALAAEMSFFLFKLYIILDALWLISSVALLTGSFCQIKEVWSLFYYFPWVILSVLLTALDVFCAVSYGPQLFNIVNVDEWLSFIGVKYKEYSDVTNNNHQYRLAILLMFLFFIRYGAIALNFIFIFIIWLAGKKAYDDCYNEASPKIWSQSSTPNSSNNNISGNFQRNEDRIRRWQEFYGEVQNDDQQFIHEETTFQTFRSEQQQDETEECKTEFTRKIIHSSSVKELQNQLPWSYSDPRQISLQKNKLSQRSSNEQNGSKTLTTRNNFETNSS